MAVLDVDELEAGALREPAARTKSSTSAVELLVAQHAHAAPGERAVEQRVVERAQRLRAVPASGRE